MNPNNDKDSPMLLLATSNVHQIASLGRLNMPSLRIFTPAVSDIPSKISISMPKVPLFDIIDQPLQAKPITPFPSDELDITPASSPLVPKLLGDILVATTVTFGVSPFLTVVDKAIVESAAGTRTLIDSGLNSIKYIVRHPIQYLKSPTFLLMWAVYSATYSTANSFKTLEEHGNYHRSRSSNVSTSIHSQQQQMGKVVTFLGTTFVNSGASILKDRAYARMFSSSGATTASSSFPRSTYAMWMMRDLSVIGSSFILPDIVSKQLVDHYGMDTSQAQSLSQLTLPVLAQFIAGPFHLLALDFYNRQNLSTNQSTFQVILNRSSKLYHGIGPVIAARIARIAPGYGIGGIWNTKLRTAWRERLVEQQDIATGSNGAQRNHPLFQFRNSAHMVALLLRNRTSSATSS